MGSAKSSRRTFDISTPEQLRLSKLSALYLLCRSDLGPARKIKLGLATKRRCDKQPDIPMQTKRATVRTQISSRRDGDLGDKVSNLRIFWDISHDAEAVLELNQHKATKQ